MNKTQISRPCHVRIQYFACKSH
uniref:Uncharacterized protein n=1 Tax=Rhizophora mucronata TaxID=61149 RepID=A0A2P2Q113_RHIMU